MRAFLLALLLTCPLFSRCDCDLFLRDHTIVLCRKTYIKHDRIVFHDHRIFVTIDDCVVETPALYSDDKGFFIRHIRLPHQSLWAFEWEAVHFDFCKWILRNCCLRPDRDCPHIVSE